MTDTKRFWVIENTEEELIAEGWRVNSTHTHIIGASIKRYNLINDGFEVELASGSTEGEIKVMTRNKE